MIPYSPLFIDSDFLSIFKSFKKIKENNNENNNEIITYSVRSSINTYFEIKNYNPGNNVLITSINIPSILNIIKYHKLNYIGIDLNIETLDFNHDDFMKKIKTKNISCLIYSHLFGRINDISWIINECKKRNIDVIEDCAECFNKNYNGNLKSDMVCFSFGSIKLMTCFGGSKTIIKDKDIFNSFKKKMNNYKCQSNFFYLLKIIKYIFISLILNYKFINLFIRKLAYFFRIDVNNILIKLIRNIKSENIIYNITYKPCYLLKKYIYYRNMIYKNDENYNQVYVNNKIDKKYYIIPGSSSKIVNYWLFPLYCKNLNIVMGKLNSYEINYVRKISQLICIDKSCLKSLDIMNNLIFLPIHKLTEFKDVNKIIYLLNNISNID